MLSAKKELFTPSGGAYQISRSVRIRQSASAYLNRTPATAGNRKTWTWSGWVKIGKAASTGLFTASTSGSNMYTIQLGVGGELTVYGYTGTYPYFRYTSAVFRDYSAWYHFVVAFDSTQATDTNRIKIYVNGVLQSTVSGSGSGWPTLNYDGGVNNTINHQFSDNVGGASYFDGYLTEVNFIDGQALTPSSFGETNALTGVWQPKRYTGTYGTNGFYLNFSDNSGATATTIGKDNSGNGNNWTPNNISVTAGVTYDSMLDVPTLYDDKTVYGRGNYPVLNPVNKGSGITISNGNLNASFTSGWQDVISTIGMPSGKWYWEVTISSLTTNMMIGICTSTFPLSTALGTDAAGESWSYFSTNGQKYFQNTATAYGAAYGVGNIIGVAFDAVNGTLTFYKDNTSQGVAFTGIPSNTYFPVSGVNGAGAHSCNFGQQPFTYTPPTGFKALNTQNLPDAPINKGNLFFDATTYSGQNTSLSITNSGSMQPDLVWIKKRNGATDHNLTDVIRGTNKNLIPNSTAVEDTVARLTSFDSGGFTLAGSFDNTNISGSTYIAWQWDAGTTTVTNTSGSISAQVRANPTAGFSIVTYTGTGANATIGHGLGVAPRMIIIFERTPGGDDHIVYHANLTSNQYSMRLNTAAQPAGPSGAYWNSTSPTSTVFSVGTSGESNQSTATYVAYCFAPVTGYSAFGSYTGNGSTDGPFIYTGFRPRWILIRSTSNLRNWLIYDTAASNPYNTGSDGPLISDGTDVTSYDGTAYTFFDILSNGFKPRNSTTNLNASGETHIYAAFAEHPFKNSLAR